MNNQIAQVCKTSIVNGTVFDNDHSEVSLIKLTPSQSLDTRISLPWPEASAEYSKSGKSVKFSDQIQISHPKPRSQK